MHAGHNSITNTMYVLCLCGDAAAHKTHEGGTPVYDLEEWCVLSISFHRVK
jgi:hypothetical protein